MNFKSHNILDPTARSKMYGLIRAYSPSVLCLSEALVPDSLAQRAPRKRGWVSAPATGLQSLADDRITHPYLACAPFEAKKLAAYGGKEVVKHVQWRDFFLAQGYTHVFFASPADCPWGANWGNCMLTKERPRETKILHLPSYGKTVFQGIPESRCALLAVVPNGLPFCTVHLDNSAEREAFYRAKQTECLVRNLKRQKLERGLTLCGDLNALDTASYDAEEVTILETLRAATGQPVPTDAVKILNDSTLFRHGRSINRGQKCDSLFQQCVTHAYSNEYAHALMQLTDATDFDHQPLFVW